MQKQVKKIKKEILNLQSNAESYKQIKIEVDQNIEKITKINNQINNLEHDIFDLEASKKEIKNSIFNNKSTEIDCIKHKKSNSLKTSTMFEA